MDGDDGFGSIAAEALGESEDLAVAERCAFRADSHDADVLCQSDLRVGRAGVGRVVRGTVYRGMLLLAAWRGINACPTWTFAADPVWICPDGGVLGGVCQRRVVSWPLILGVAAARFSDFVASGLFEVGSLALA